MGKGGGGGEEREKEILQERDDLLDRLEIAELQLKDRITKGEEANILNVSISSSLLLIFMIR